MNSKELKKFTDEIYDRARQLDSKNLGTMLYNIGRLHTVATRSLAEDGRPANPMVMLTLINADVMGKLLMPICDIYNAGAQLTAGSLFDRVSLSLAKLLDDPSAMFLFIDLLTSKDLDKICFAVNVLFKLRFKFATNDPNIGATINKVLEDDRTPLARDVDKMVHSVHTIKRAQGLNDVMNSSLQYHSSRARKLLIFRSEMLACLKELLLNDDVNAVTKCQIIQLVNTKTPTEIKLMIDEDIVPILMILRHQSETHSDASTVIGNYMSFSTDDLLESILEFVDCVE